MLKLMKRPPIDEIADLLQALTDIKYDDWVSVQGPLRKALDKHNDIMLALPFKRPLREELAEWLNAPLLDPEPYDWESTEGCRP